MGTNYCVKIKWKWRDDLFSLFLSLYNTIFSLFPNYVAFYYPKKTRFLSLLFISLYLYMKETFFAWKISTFSWYIHECEGDERNMMWKK
jgi:hypothetical protein